MSVLVYTESSKGIFKKNTPELVSYGSELSKKIGVELFVLVFNVEDCSMLSQYGATNILKVDNDGLNLFENKTWWPWGHFWAHPLTRTLFSLTEPLVRLEKSVFADFKAEK